ncbi:MAG: ExbD/TolR family protein [Gammaproteobacteria bacterium]|nr:ExbD/TolR family protein [Gammaproteobacteria bacterium]MYF01973.1 ExbD/TolR family protein [Gammaproteobacteria bacterium]MYI78091.1 ExbD/TolR family protein [Gammaproteobacteria bacterium]
MAKRRQPMSQINIVPLIDVMLVLLIVSMVTVPLLNQGIEVNLPQDSSGTLEDYDEDPLVVTVRADKRIYVNVGVSAEFDEDSFISFEEMQERTEKVLSARPNVPVFIRGDQALDYGYVMQVIHALKEAGADDVGLVTEPEEI